MFPCCQEVISASSDPGLVLFNLSHAVCSVGPCTQRSHTASSLKYFFSSLAVPIQSAFALFTGVDLACSCGVWAQRLPGVPTLCSPPEVLSCLSETCKHKAYRFSMIPPFPKHAVLLSCGVSFGGSLCFTGCKL